MINKYWHFDVLRYYCFYLLFYTLLFVLVFASFAEGQLAGSFSRSLFSNEKTVLDISGVDWSLIHPSASSCPWIVMFYIDTCGHCRSVAPKYSKFAKKIEDSFEEDPLLLSMTAAVNCVTDIKTCRKFEIYGVPRFLLFLPSNCSGNGNESCTMKNENVQDITSIGFAQLPLEIRRRIRQNMRINGSLMERCVDLRHGFYAYKDSQIRNRSVKKIKFVENKKLYLTDIAGAFFYTLFHEVSLVGFDSPERLGALKDFLKLVEVSLPGLEAGIILDTVSNMENSESFSVTRWQKAIISANIPFKGTPRSVQWITCKGSSFEYRGFPCAMWLLYHSLTVNTDSEANVLGVIQNYVRYFFSCEDCRQHFLQFNFESDKDPILQLWIAHNKVNERLSASKESTDPLVPKIQFPDSTMCKECYNSNDTFNDQSVLSFLQERYEWDPDALEIKDDDKNNNNDNYDDKKGGNNNELKQQEIAADAGVDEGQPFRNIGNKEDETVYRDPIPLNFFLTALLVVVILTAGILRMRGRFTISKVNHRYRSRV